MKIQARTLAVVMAVGALSVIAAPSQANNEGDVTYYRDVLPIIQDNCQSCHQPEGQNLGGVLAPMSFMNYQETRPWARAIASKVEAREMPPVVRRGAEGRLLERTPADGRGDRDPAELGRGGRPRRRPD